MKAHREMYVEADHCPECGVVPLHKGHTCAHGSNDSCPRCGIKITDYEHRDECEWCPFCRGCCEELDAAFVFAQGVADECFSYKGTNEHDVRYVKMMQSSIRGAKTNADRRRMLNTLAEFIFSESLLDGAAAQSGRTEAK